MARVPSEHENVGGPAPGGRILHRQQLLSGLRMAANYWCVHLVYDGASLGVLCGLYGRTGDPYCRLPVYCTWATWSAVSGVCGVLPANNIYEGC